MAAGLPSMKSVLTPLAKSVLLPSGLSAGMSASYAAIQKKSYGLQSAALIISIEEMEDITKIVKLLVESGLLIKGISGQLNMKQKNKKEDFLEFYYVLLAWEMH